MRPVALGDLETERASSPPNGSRAQTRPVGQEGRKATRSHAHSAASHSNAHVASRGVNAELALPDPQGPQDPLGRAGRRRRAGWVVMAPPQARLVYTSGLGAQVDLVERSQRSAALACAEKGIKRAAPASVQWRPASRHLECRVGRDPTRPRGDYHGGKRFDAPFAAPPSSPRPSRTDSSARLARLRAKFAAFTSRAAQGDQRLRLRRAASLEEFMLIKVCPHWVVDVEGRPRSGAAFVGENWPGLRRGGSASLFSEGNTPPGSVRADK